MSNDISSSRRSANSNNSAGGAARQQQDQRSLVKQTLNALTSIASAFVAPNKTITKEIDDLKGDIKNGVENKTLTAQGARGFYDDVELLSTATQTPGQNLTPEQEKVYRKQIARIDDEIKLAKFTSREDAHAVRLERGTATGGALSEEEGKNICAKLAAVESLKDAVWSDGVMTDTEEAAIVAGLSAVDDAFLKAENNQGYITNVGSPVQTDPTAATKVFAARQAEQDRKMDAGYADKSLTREELLAVSAKYVQADNFKKAAESDGEITLAETNALTAMFKVTDQAIYEARNGVVIK